MPITCPFFQPIWMILVSKFMLHRALTDKTYLLGLLSPLNLVIYSFSVNILTLPYSGIYILTPLSQIEYTITLIHSFGVITC